MDDPPLTVAEFLRFEAYAEERHEFFGGRIHAMTGATTRHNRIAGNVYVRLRTLADGGGCRVYMEGVQLRLPGAVLYPDVMVVCAPDGDDERAAVAPCLLVEVLSPSTAHHDQGSKLEIYRALPSVQAYLIVEQERPAVTRHWRDATDRWQSEMLVGSGAVALPCPAPGGVLTLDDVYRGLSFDTPPALRRIHERVAD